VSPWQKSCFLFFKSAEIRPIRVIRVLLKFVFTPLKQKKPSGTRHLSGQPEGFLIGALAS